MGIKLHEKINKSLAILRIEKIPKGVYNVITGQGKASPKEREKEMKYVLYIDYRSGKHTKAYEYRAMNAKDFREAIEEADEALDTETMYLIRILEKCGKAKKMDGFSVQEYEAIECKRSTKWRANTIENGENKQMVTRYYGKGMEWFD